MEFSLINGSYPKQDAIDILSRMIQVKIDFHTGKFESEKTEDAKNARLTRIEELEEELNRVKAAINASKNRIAISSQIRF